MTKSSTNEEDKIRSKASYEEDIIPSIKHLYDQLFRMYDHLKKQNTKLRECALGRFTQGNIDLMLSSQSAYISKSSLELEKKRKTRKDIDHERKKYHVYKCTHYKRI